MQNLQNVICITDRHLCHRPFQDQMRIVAAMKPKAVILREKDVMEDTYRILAERILPVCEEQGVPMIVHTFYNVALEMGIKRVQIPLSQLRDVPEETRKQFEVLGTTVHSVEDAKEAVSLGATYLTASLASGGAHEYGTQNKRAGRRVPRAARRLPCQRRCRHLHDVPPHDHRRRRVNRHRE